MNKKYGKVGIVNPTVFCDQFLLTERLVIYNFAMEGILMPRVAKLSKSEIADVLTRVFVEYGYAGASLAMLSSVSGLSKASLYHHFPRGKEDMAAFVLGRSGMRFQKHILAPLQSTVVPSERLAQSFAGVEIYYNGDAPTCLMNSLMLGDGFPLFGEQVRKTVDVWRQGLSAGYKALNRAEMEADVWAAGVVGGIQGALILCRLQQSREPLELCMQGIMEKTGLD